MTDQIGKAEIFKLTGEILTAHIANNSVPAGDLAGLIGSVHEALTRAASAQAPEMEYLEPVQTEPAPEPMPRSLMPAMPALPPGAMMLTEREPEQEPAVPIAEALTDDTIYCLECGRGMQMLKRHLFKVHDLTPEQYRRKWHLPRKYPMVSNAWTVMASERAKAPGGPSEKMVAAKLAKKAAAALPEPPTLELATEPEPPAPQPAVSVEESIQPDRLICMDCGKGVKGLPTHLKLVHHLTPEAYRAKWELPGDYPMITTATAERLREVAKERGLGTLIGRNSKPTGKTRLALIGAKEATG